jgi:acetylornithine deacetylase/succinyl-diaminopimelate desuccinylase-like protein
MTGWLDGLSPIHPKIIGDKLYGRGGADDGYAAFTAILSIKAL